MTTPSTAPAAVQRDLGALAPLHQQIASAQARFGEILTGAVSDGPVSVDQYCRYLTMQYHLTQDVQAYFFAIAANSAFAKRRKLRRFLTDFANEEELHYLIAGKDLLALGRKPLAEPFDVTLWHSYFRSVVTTRPFLRLGAAAVLENISAGAARAPVQRALSAPFMTKENTKFLVLHQHETLPHGDQILDALAAESFTGQELADLFLGARQGSVMYLRMAKWAVDENEISTCADTGAREISSIQARDIQEFDLSQLNPAPE